MKKYFKILFFILLFFSTIGINDIFAVGDLGFQFNIGVTYDLNNLEKEIVQYNTAMEVYKNANSGTQVVQLNVPFAAVFNFNFKYQVYYFMIRIGASYSKAFLYSTMGSIKPAAGTKNTIRMETYQATFPLTIGIVLPFTKRITFYCGGGGSFFITHLKITQSDPNATYGLPSNNAKDTSDSYFFGFHVVIGLEFPIIPKLTISSEWVYQQGISPLIGSNSSNKRTFDISANYILLGINYYISI